jgi:site-specific DNA recombinase
MKGIIYTRVSSEEQVKGTSLEFQEELCRNYCKQKGIDIVADFREEGESAKNLSLNNRHQFLAALEFCRKQKKQIDAFVVLRVDRFARNTEDHFAIRKVLRDYGTTLHSVTEPIGDKPAEKFIETVLAGAAEYDNALRKQRCTEGMQSRINQGIYPWKPPIGYICLQAKKKGEKKNQADPIDPKTFPIIQQALKNFATGDYTLTEITRQLDHNKSITPQFTTKLFDKYLLFYAGFIRNPWSNEKVQGKHTPMITEEELFQIQCIRGGKNPTIRKRMNFSPIFPLRRTIKCGKCSRYLTAAKSKGKYNIYPYYFCQNKVCPQYGKCFSKEIIENDFSKFISSIKPGKEYLSFLENIIPTVWKGQLDKYNSTLNIFNEQIKNLESKKKRIYDMYEDGIYTREEFILRKNAIETDTTSVKNNFKANDISDHNPTQIMHYVANFLSNMDKQWKEMTAALKHEFCNLIFPEGIFYEVNIGYRTPKLGIIFSLNTLFHTSNYPGVDPVICNLDEIVQELKHYEKLLKELEEEKQYSQAA